MKLKEWMDGWEKWWKLVKMINNQKNEMNEWTLKIWNDWMDGWKNKRKEISRKWMNEILKKKLKLKWWIYSVV